MAKVYYRGDNLNPKYPGKDRAYGWFCFSYARPADFCVTLDVATKEPNIMAGTVGPLTWKPFTMCLHIEREHSVDSYRNLRESKECVISVPTRDLIRQTWLVGLHVPRGISEFEVAKLTPFPSKWVEPPGIKECPVNFECKVDFFNDYYTHGIVFVRVIGASIDEEIFGKSREEIVNQYPTYEIDTIGNKYGGSTHRLGIMGEIFECPTFPVGSESGLKGTFRKLVNNLRERGYINGQECANLIEMSKRYQDLFYEVDNSERKKLHKRLTEICTYLAWEEWEGLHRYMKTI